MKSYKVRISPDALLDIQEATNWYNDQVPKLGTRFQEEAKSQINKLKNNPIKHSIRYVNVRCALIKKFPFLIHFIIDEENQIVEIFCNIAH